MQVSLIGHRKWSVCMLALLLAFVLALFGRVSGAEFAMVASIAVGAFTAANAFGDHRGG